MTTYARHLTELKAVNESTVGNAHPWYRHGTDDVHFTEDLAGNVTLDMKGTERTLKEWCVNFWIARDPWLDMGMVHSGFANNIISIYGGRDDPDSLLSRCLRSGGLITLRGHSRGGPGSMLAATYLVKQGVPVSRIRVIVYGCPRFGDGEFTRKYRELLGMRTTTINISRDPVTWASPWGRRHGEHVRVRRGSLIPAHSLVDYEKTLIKAGV